jgi:hypothetical protein
MAVALFLVGFTVLAGGLAGGGVILDLVGVVILGASAFFFAKCKPWEHQSE